MTTVILVLAVSWLAYSNGANDNFKGVATLYGSGTLAYRPALGLATLALARVRLTCRTVKPPALSAASVSFGSFADMPGTFAEKCRNRRSLGVSGDPLATLIVHLTVPRAVLHDADRSLADTNLPSTR